MILIERFVVFSLLEINKKRPFYFVLGLSFIFGGGVSNLIDRVRLGSVTDYFDLWYWIFNLADVFIIVGSVMLIVFYIKKARAFS